MAYGAATSSPTYGADANPSAYGGGAAEEAYGPEAAMKTPGKVTPQKGYYEIADCVLGNIAGASSSKYLRLIFWGGAQGHDDNSAFFNAAKILRKSYGEALIYDRPLHSAKLLVAAINAQNPSSVQSLDIICHGGPLALFMVSSRLPDKTFFCSPLDPSYSFSPKFLDEDKAAAYRKSFGADVYKEMQTAIPQYQKNKIQSALYSSSMVLASAPIQSFLAEGFGDATRAFESTVASLDFEKFTDAAKIEIHGCRTAESYILVGSLCEALSLGLFNAGKSEAVVIGHVTKATPDAGGDYRHGARLCLHNGRILFQYNDDGRISKATIDKYLAEKADGLWDDKFPSITKGVETKVDR